MCVSIPLTYILLQVNFYWIVPNFVIKTILHDFVKKSKQNFHDNSVQDTLDLLQKYEALKKSLNKYLLLFYSAIQSEAIFSIFYTISRYSKEEGLDNYELSGSILTISSAIVNLAVLTSALDEAYQAILTIRWKIYEELSMTPKDLEETRQLEYCKNMAELVRPMTASGYFEIDKTTLTSMLSVRQVSLPEVMTQLATCFFAASPTS